MVLPAESVTVLNRGVVMSMEVVSLGLGACGGRLGLGPGFSLIRPYYYSSGRIANKQSYGEHSFWVRGLSQPSMLIVMPDSPNLLFEPVNFFLLPHLGKGYIYGATSMLQAVSHLCFLKAGEQL